MERVYLRYFVYDNDTGDYYAGKKEDGHTFTKDALKAKMFKTWDDAELRRKIVEHKLKKRLWIGVTADRKGVTANECET